MYAYSEKTTPADRMFILAKVRIKKQTSKKIVSFFSCDPSY